MAEAFVPLPLHLPRHFLFTFDEDRRIPRFHLERVDAGTRVSIYRLDSVTHAWRELLATAIVGLGGWVDLAEPLIGRPSEGFVVVPEASPPAKEPG